MGVRIQSLAKRTAEGIYGEIAHAVDRDAMYRHAKNSQNKKAIDAMIWLARSEPGISADITTFDADPLLLNVNNGTLDLRTGTLRSHCRDHMITRLAKVEWNTDADYDLWDSFIWKITGCSDELYKYLRRLVGYLLTGLTIEQVLHFLYGLGGNGKSVFCDVLLALLGEYAIVVSPEMVMQRRHGGIPNDIARLRGVRVAMMNETSQGSRFDEAKLKDLTGGDRLSGRFLHKEFFDFDPTHKLVIRGNHKPCIHGTDEGIWRRLRLVPFTVTIPEDQRDLNLTQKLMAELPGILKWAVDGCLEWQRDGLIPPRIIVDAVGQYREESDTLGRFVAECCEVRKLGQVKSSTLFKRYQEFCEQAGERWLPSKDFPAEMQRRAFEWKRTNAGGLFLGIELRGNETATWEEK
jgi:putative DNA primase/helicase